MFDAAAYELVMRPCSVLTNSCLDSQPPSAFHATILLDNVLVCVVVGADDCSSFSDVRLSLAVDYFRSFQMPSSWCILQYMRRFREMCHFEVAPNCLILV